ncbi:AfsR/SARP family transcriptional regulator [Actinophytocola xanthii]|uniref:AfsR/SARP family transcriptional regulator n=1 Tax=Actinophytocola xanthii TaxID=1912961 RepID=UPI000AD50209|nr:BTAD domain-containing putative transcriptional regulator [Actinophytocola xanthii]
MELRLLGEMRLRAGGTSLDVGGRRQQAVLAALAVDAGRPVGIETLIDRVWDAAPPARARDLLYSRLSRLRQLVRQANAAAGEPVAKLERRPAGYVLDLDADLVDLHRFRRLVEHGRDPRLGDAQRSAALGEALALWRGTPLANLSGAWVEQVRDVWHQARLDALVQWARLCLRLGHAAEVIGVLQDVVAEHPLVEPLEVLLMRALRAAGRDAEALHRFAAVRQRLADELGTDPGAELRDLHQAILRGEPEPAPASARPVSPPVSPPAQLPPDTAVFTGRGSQLRHLDGLLAGVSAAGSTAVVISAVSGTAGVGKTALAVHWAHQVRDRFPDGQLYVNLRGFDPGGPPVAPAEAVRRFLDAFDVAPASVPVSPEAQVGLYRSLLADRRVLVVLDNARDTEQVRPLLPGAATCLVLVTSRQQLTGLIADGAHPITLDLLTVAEAREFLARRLGAHRVAAEPTAADRIATRCARLPLALAVVAARAATHPHFELAVLADELHQARDLTPFAGADPTADVRSVFSWSYRQLTSAAARLFQLLGLHPGPDIAVPAAAELADLAPPYVRPLLAELAHAHLLVEHRPGRYTFHDLLRAYAAEQAATLPARERQRALRRLVGHYLRTAYTADRILHPHRDPIEVPTGPHDPPALLPDEAAAWAWFSAEHPCLLAVQQLAAERCWHREVWQLAWTLDTFQYRRGRRQDLVTVWQAGLAAAQREGDTATVILAHRRLGHVCANAGRHDDALDQLGRALALANDSGDLPAEAHAHHALAWAWGRQGEDERALEHAASALDLYRALGQAVSEAAALNSVGWYSARLGHHERADTHLRAALELARRHGHREGEADTLDSLGYLAERCGQHDRALDHYQRARALLRGIGDTYGEADILERLGNAHTALGDHDQARQAWRQAHSLFQAQRRGADAERVQRRLDAARGEPGGGSSSSTARGTGAGGVVEIPREPAR